jgi:hypothetical protein
MTRAGAALAALALAAGIPAWAADGLDAHKLRRDPFDPQRTGRTDARPAQADSSAAPWRPQLRAVLVAGDQSMANVGGIIVKQGGQVDGFRLLEVKERTAVFVRNGVRLTLSMDRDKER